MVSAISSRRPVESRLIFAESVTKWIWRLDLELVARDLDVAPLGPLVHLEVDAAVFFGADVDGLHVEHVAVGFALHGDRSGLQVLDVEAAVAVGADAELFALGVDDANRTPLTGVLESASSALPVTLPVFASASSGQSTSMKVGPKPGGPPAMGPEGGAPTAVRPGRPACREVRTVPRREARPD